MTEPQSRDDLVQAYQAAEQFARDESRPSQTTRDAILAHARNAKGEAVRVTTIKSISANQSFWSWSAVATLVGGLMIGTLATWFWQAPPAEVAAVPQPTEPPTVVAAKKEVPVEDRAEPKKDEPAPAQELNKPRSQEARAQLVLPQPTPASSAAVEAVAKRSDAAMPKVVVDSVTSDSVATEKAPQLVTPRVSAGSPPPASAPAPAPLAAAPALPTPVPSALVTPSPAAPAPLVAAAPASARASVQKLEADALALGGSAVETAPSARPSMQKSDTRTPTLGGAIAARSLPMLNRWLRSTSDSERALQINQRLQNGDLPLTQILRASMPIPDQVALIKILLQSGADPRLVDDFRLGTPSNAIDLVRLLNDPQLTALFSKH